VIKEIPGVFHNDPNMSHNDIEKIKILSELNSSSKWENFVSLSNRHFMLLQDDEWPSKIIADDNFLYRWVEDWNEDFFLHFSSILNAIDLPGNSELYVFWMKEVGLKTNWDVFCRNWINFLYEDEGCILVLPDSDKSIVLSNGVAWLGTRGVLKT